MNGNGGMTWREIVDLYWHFAQDGLDRSLEILSRNADVVFVSSFVFVSALIIAVAARRGAE